VLEAKDRHDLAWFPRNAHRGGDGGADDHRLTLSAAGAADGEELIAPLRESSPQSKRWWRGRRGTSTGVEGLTGLICVERHGE